MRKLEDLVNAEYQKSKLTDVAFASYATQMPQTQVNASHVAGAREVFGMISNRDAARAAEKTCDGTALARLADLEEEVRVLTTRFEKLLAKLGGA
jgi:uncharacterized protein YceH (UPF0502 family)